MENVINVTIAERSYTLDIKKLKLKALQALQNFKASEDLNELIGLMSLLLNEPDKVFLTEEMTIGHMLEIKQWAESVTK